MIIPPDVLAVLNALESAGFEAFLVGGCVRDMLLGFLPQDYDICTNANPAQMRTAFSGFPVYETGLKHGTLTVGSKGMLVEVTTYRIDGDYSDNRRPDSVKFTSELKEDLARRDFTINAMACDKNGVVLDFFGGKTALANKVVACVGNAAMRFEEDSLRILRGLRFSAIFGFAIESETAAAMCSKKHLLNNVSVERVREEITKLLCGNAVGNILQGFSDVLFEVLPELRAMLGFAQNHPYHEFDVWEHTIKVVENTLPVAVLRWAALLHDSGKPHCYTEESGCGHFYGHPQISTEIADAILSRLKFDNKTKDKILLLVKQHDNPLLPDSAFIKRRLNQIGENNLRGLLLFIRADTAGHSKLCRKKRLKKIEEFETELNRVLEYQPCFTLKQLAVNGKDLIDIGYACGKEIGVVLTFLLEAVMDGNCNNRKDELLQYLNESGKYKFS
jgi:tRNA nucleotidyltransferase (CCA-adding enzyme)